MLKDLKQKVNYLLSGGSVTLSSPDGTKYRIVVANGGALSTEEVV